MDFVPIMRCANTTTCSSPGTCLCSKCHLVKYCSKDCQNAHWNLHKKDCKSPLVQNTWEPDWVTAKRKPAFVISGSEPIFSQHGLNKHLWGNTPAFDHIQLHKNEGAAWDQPIALCFAASGDLRNVVTSINCLPESYCLPCSLVVNDREMYIVLRNLLLLFTFASFPIDEAAEVALHLWYSPKLPSNTAARLRAIFNERLNKIFTHMAKNPSSPPDTLLKAKFQLTDKTSVVALLPKWFWGEMKKMLDLKMNSQQADYQRHLITLNHERRDYRDRYFCLLTPYHRIATMKYYEDGLVVPFGGINKSTFVEPNFTLFDLSGRWMLNDSQNPLLSWSYSELESSFEKHCLPSNDIYGALHFHLLAQFRLFASALRSREIQFTLLGEDARRIPATLQKSLKDVSPQKFDRVDVSNTSDTCYLGIEVTLTLLGDLLRPAHENPHATLVTLFMNYPMETPIPESAQIATMMKTMKIVRPLLLMDGEASPLKSEYDVTAIKMSTWTRYFEDCREQWREYAELHRFDDLCHKTGLEEKRTRTIIEKMPYRVNKDLGINDLSKAVKHLDFTGLVGHECYIEWVRAQ